MQTTEIIKLKYVTESEESTTKVRDYRRSTSDNFCIIDNAIGELVEMIDDNAEAISDLSGAVKDLQDKSIYLCSSKETGTLEDGTNVPNIESPNPSVVYLVSSGDAVPNMWLEYIWVNNQWEQWGSASVDLSNYLTEDDAADIIDRIAVVKDQGKDKAGSILYVDSNGNLVVSNEHAKEFWQGKHAIFFGTSITAYCRSADRANYGTCVQKFGTGGYCYKLANALGMTTNVTSDNYGKAGSFTIVPNSSDTDLYNHYKSYGSICDIVTSNKNAITNADIVFVETATNDYKKGVSLGSTSSASSSNFCGALNTIITYIKSANPNALIVLLADTERGSNLQTGQWGSSYKNGIGKTLYDYVKAMRNVAEYRDVIFCDWYTYSGITEKNADEYTWDNGATVNGTTYYDCIHLNKDGYSLVSDLTKRTLLEYSAINTDPDIDLSDIENRLYDLEIELEGISALLDEINGEVVE